MMVFSFVFLKSWLSHIPFLCRASDRDRIQQRARLINTGTTKGNAVRFLDSMSFTALDQSLEPAQFSLSLWQCRFIHLSTTTTIRLESWQNLYYLSSFSFLTSSALDHKERGTFIRDLWTLNPRSFPTYRNNWRANAIFLTVLWCFIRSAGHSLGSFISRSL